MVFNFLESGIKLFDDTFNAIKDLFAVCIENETPNSLVKTTMGLNHNQYYVRWYTSDTTYYTLILEPNSSVASDKARLMYYNGTNSIRMFYFNVT